MYLPAVEGVRQLIESANDTLKDQPELDQY